MSKEKRKSAWSEGRKRENFLLHKDAVRRSASGRIEPPRPGEPAASWHRRIPPWLDPSELPAGEAAQPAAPDKPAAPVLSRPKKVSVRKTGSTPEEVVARMMKRRLKRYR